MMFEYELKEGAFSLNTNFEELFISPDSSLGFKPVELFISSLVGCSGGVFRKILDKKRLDVSNIRIKANVERNKLEANKITKIDFLFIVEGKNLSIDQVEKALQVTIKNCGMIQSVIGSIEINESAEVINLT
ncbi:OsmC family protein [Neobacillus sp. D3-1R]|uniref:OsmC family protein n=1 Tax=Neobacillus sp. D3-1R TaxID=3445778 RepID=UPI003FA10FD1